MKINRRMALGGAVFILLLGGLLYRFTMRAPQVTSRKPHGKAIYYCPMHPGYTADRPGDCPICSMKLVKREMGTGEAPAAPQEERPAAGASGEQAPSGYASVRITPQEQRLIGIETAPARKRALTQVIRTVGMIAFDPELYQAQEEYLQAARALQEARERAMPEMVEQAQRLADAVQIRLRLLGVNDSVIEEIRKSGRPDRGLLLNDTQKGVWLYAPIYEFELPFVKAGQIVTVDVPSLPGETFEGTVRAIDPVLDPVTRSARVRALLKDPGGLLKPHMFVNVSLRITVGEVLAVPEEAVFDTGTRRVVFVDKGEGRLQPREVTLGAKAQDAYEVKSGISEGERVVVRGNFLIDSESRLKSALEKVDSGGEHRHAH